MSRDLTAAALLLLTSGCVAGRVHTFNYVPQETSRVGGGKIVVVLPTEDRRSYVMSGDEPPDFVGEQRNGYGIPFNVTTSDRRSFASVVQETVKRDLGASGFQAVESPAGGDVLRAIASAGAWRAIAVLMHEFKSDTMNNINFDYDFEAIVYDGSGVEVARERVAGEEVIAGSLMNPIRAAREKVPPHFYEKIHNLVTGNTKIMRALTQ